MTRRAAPRFPYTDITNTTLPGWNISLVFVGATRARTLNKKLRNKDYVPNVLSYQLGERSGEVIICLDVLKKQAPAYCLLPPAYCLLLFIHGLLHLKGHPHGPTMERKERELLARFVGISLNKNGSTKRLEYRGKTRG